jgi:NAD(P)-dependent dehydrogenase (short-subunit alcohol dehydrogenase family)
MGFLDGKAVVITGSGGGIGEAYAHHAALEGARVIVNDVDAASAHRVAAAIRAEGGTASAHVASVASWDGAAGLIAHCVQTYGCIDGLVNNAAVFHMALPEEEEEAAVRALIEVNVLGTMYCGIHASRHMLARGRGSIVNITSGAQAGLGRQGSYGASKGAVASLTYTWAIDMGARGVRVNAVSPMARSRMADQAQQYLVAHGQAPWPQMTITPEDNTPVLVYLLSDRSAAINGQVVRIDGQRLALMTHPAVLHPPLRRELWTVQDVADAFANELAALQLPLGVVALDAQPRAYVLDYDNAAGGAALAP